MAGLMRLLVDPRFLTAVAIIAIELAEGLESRRRKW